MNNQYPIFKSFEYSTLSNGYWKLFGFCFLGFEY